MTHAASTAPTLVGALWVAGLASLAVITLASPGATRMNAWPWSIASAIALAAWIVARWPWRKKFLPPSA